MRHTYHLTNLETGKRITVYTQLPVSGEAILEKDLLTPALKAFILEKEGFEHGFDGEPEDFIAKHLSYKGNPWRFLASYWMEHKASKGERWIQAD